MYELLNSDLSTLETTPTLVSWLLQSNSHASLPQRSSLEEQLIISRVISIVTTSLDTLILLEDKYNLLETLLQQQRAASMENGWVIVITVSSEKHFDPCILSCDRKGKHSCAIFLCFLPQ